MDDFQQIEELMIGAKKDYQDFYEKGNQTAGTRLRQKMMQVLLSAKVMRTDVTRKKNERKKKK
jgi:hypothetical protein